MGKTRQQLKEARRRAADEAVSGIQRAVDEFLKSSWDVRRWKEGGGPDRGHRIAPTPTLDQYDRFTGGGR